VGADDVEDRIIAPVPDKSQGLKQVFIRATYARAASIVRDSGTVVSIGYSFNSHDRGSYQTLLNAMCESEARRLLVVCPDADTVAQAVHLGFPHLSVEAINSTFKQWVTESFPGLR
jgi:hypothetical protein